MSHHNSSTSQPVYNQQGRPCGYIRGGTFYRKFNPVKHILRALGAPALAFDVCAVEQAARAGADTICAFDGAGTEYRCSLEHFQRVAKPVDFGYGSQLAMLLTGFTTTRRGKAMQLPLFGGAR